VAVILAVLAARPSDHLTAQELTTVRFTVSSPAAVDSVRRLGVDVVETRPRPDRRVDIVAVVAERDRLLLLQRGWAPADVPRAPQMAAMEAARRARGAAAFVVYRDFDDPARGVAAYLRAFVAARVNASLDSIGASVEGRPLLAVKLGLPDDSPSRPNVLFMATYHAREWGATEMALRLLNYLADSVPATLSGRDVWILPVVNPDGFQYTFTTQRLWRKNRARNGDGTFGVDLNRNHDAYWGLDDVGSSGQMAAETYRGPAAASEPEIRAVEAFHRAHPLATSVSYHTYTGSVLYPWGHRNALRTGDEAVFRALAGTDLAPAIRDSIPGSVNRYYHPGPGWQLYPVNGDYTSYAYLQARTAAFTVELTSGCCLGGGYYGFEFPDDEALLERMFRDNLRFALGLIAAAGNPTGTVIPPGAPAPAQQFETVWPELRALLLAPVPPTTPVNVAVDSAIVAVRAAQRDSLGIGRGYGRMIVTDASLEDARASRVPEGGLSAELLIRDGAEQPGTGWTGFRRDTTGFRSAASWLGYRDTLRSPDIPVAGRSNLALYFWSRHNGSVFAQQLRGSVQIMLDGGPEWVPVAELVGAAPEWYPVAVPLPMAAGATSLRLRFIAQDMDWWVDALAVTASDASVGRLFGSGALPPPQVEVSANPVRTAPVTLRWLPGTGSARVTVFSVTGTRIAGTSLTTDPGRWQWDLTTDEGRPVANGAYFVVVTLDNGTVMRRRLLVAR